MAEDMAAKIAAKMAEKCWKMAENNDENVCIECTKWLEKNTRQQHK